VRSDALLALQATMGACRLLASKHIATIRLVRSCREQPFSAQPMKHSAEPVPAFVRDRYRPELCLVSSTNRPKRVHDNRLPLGWEGCRCIGREPFQRSSSLSLQSYSLNSLQVGLATQERRAATVLPTSCESMAMLKAQGTLMGNSAMGNSAMHWGAIASSRLVGLRQAVVVEPSRYRLSKTTNFHSRFH